MPTLEIRHGLTDSYSDIYTPDVLAALEALAHFDEDRRRIMAARIARRADRARHRQRIEFLEPGALIPRTELTVQAARDGNFTGSAIPPDLQRQWVQGTGPGTKPEGPLESTLRNVAYALLSGADGWMFDGEDALGQISTMALDNQRNLKLAIARAPIFLQVAEQVAGEMNVWARSFFGRPIVDDWKGQLDFTTKLFRPRGLHLDDRHVRRLGADGFSASIVDATLYLVNNHQALRAAGSSLVLYLPKIQTAEEAALWSDILSALESHLGLPAGAIKVYVLVEQIEACFQLMEIRAALGPHFVGFNTGRWDYINSVSDAMAWDPDFVNPNIDAITMTYGYMRQYRGPRAACGQHARPAGPVRALAGRHGAQHSGRVFGRRRARDAAGRGRRRARAARGRQRQVGRALEDGAHRPPGLGARRRDEPARPAVSAAHLHGGGRAGADDARAGAADHTRRA